MTPLSSSSSSPGVGSTLDERYQRADACAVTHPIRDAAESSIDAGVFARSKDWQALPSTGQLCAGWRGTSHSGWWPVEAESGSGECVHIRLHGRDVLARPELIRDVGEVDRLLRRMHAINPRITSFAPVTGQDGRIDRARVEAAMSFGFAIVRWHFDCAQDRIKNA